MELPPEAGRPDSDPDPDATLRAFVLETGRALSLAGAAVNETEERLTRIGAVNGAPDTRIVVLPTALLVSLGRTRPTTIDAIPQQDGVLRLDQIWQLYDLVRRAERGEVTPADGLASIEKVREMPPRYGGVVTVLAYSLMTAALCLILQPTPRDVAVAAVLGAVVGVVVRLTQGHPTVAPLVPVASAMLVTTLALTAVSHGLADPGLRTLIAPLILFLPGGVLTTATVELASGEMVAGASRLVSGTLQLLLLAFGIVAGTEIAGLPGRDVLDGDSVNLLGWWAPWAGVLLFGVANALYFSARRGTLAWLLAVLLAAWVGQLLGDRLVGPDVSGFFGALAMTPVALAVARLPAGPPSQVTFLPAFWLLVPGAIGLIEVTEIVSDPASAGLEDIVRPLAAVIAIALGVLCGVTVWQAAGAAVRRLRRRGGCSGPRPRRRATRCRSRPRGR